MNEDDTFNKLKSLTPLQAEVIFQKVWIEIAQELEAMGDDSSKGGVPIVLLRERVDIKLKPYGWTYDKLFPWTAGQVS